MFVNYEPQTVSTGCKIGPRLLCSQAFRRPLRKPFCFQNSLFFEKPLFSYSFTLKQERSHLDHVISRHVFTPKEYSICIKLAFNSSPPPPPNNSLLWLPTITTEMSNPILNKQHCLNRMHTKLDIPISLLVKRRNLGSKKIEWKYYHLRSLCPCGVLFKFRVMNCEERPVVRAVMKWRNQTKREQTAQFFSFP